MPKRDSRLTPEDLQKMVEPSDSQYRMMALAVVVILVLSAIFTTSAPAWVWIVGLLVVVAIAIAYACIYCSQLPKNKRKPDDAASDKPNNH